MESTCRNVTFRSLIMKSSLFKEWKLDFFGALSLGIFQWKILNLQFDSLFAWCACFLNLHYYYVRINDNSIMQPSNHGVFSLVSLKRILASNIFIWKCSPSIWNCVKLKIARCSRDEEERYFHSLITWSYYKGPVFCSFIIYSCKCTPIKILSTHYLDSSCTELVCSSKYIAKGDPEPPRHNQQLEINAASSCYSSNCFS